MTCFLGVKKMYKVLSKCLVYTTPTERSILLFLLCCFLPRSSLGLGLALGWEEGRSLGPGPEVSVDMLTEKAHLLP